MTIRLEPTPRTRYAPSRACYDEIAVYRHAVVHTLDEERSEMWLLRQHRQSILDDVWAMTSDYRLPVLVESCGGRALCLLNAPNGEVVLDHLGEVILATGAPSAESVRELVADEVLR